jgi:hypothetical protein
MFDELLHVSECCLFSVCCACSVAAGLSRAGSAEPDFYTQAMNVLCPLDDDCLPLEAANLKTRQVRTCACADSKLRSHFVLHKPCRVAAGQPMQYTA